MKSFLQFLIIGLGIVADRLVERDGPGDRAAVSHLRRRL